MSQLIYDPQLTKVLASIGDFVPTGMTLDRLPYFREISSPTRKDLLQNYPVNCVDHRIPGYEGDEFVISVITRKGHDQTGPAIFFLHGGGMVMGNRFAGAAPLVEWAIKHDAGCVTSNTGWRQNIRRQFRWKIAMQACCGWRRIRPRSSSIRIAWRSSVGAVAAGSRRARRSWHETETVRDCWVSCCSAL